MTRSNRPHDPRLIARLMRVLNEAARSREELCLTRMASDKAWEQFDIIDGLEVVETTLRENAAYQMPWADIDAAIDADERIASPTLRTQNDTDPNDDAAMETLDALTTPIRIDRRLQFADRYYTP